jgi:hypothetical protein
MKTIAEWAEDAATVRRWPRSASITCRAMRWRARSRRKNCWRPAPRPASSRPRKCSQVVRTLGAPANEPELPEFAQLRDLTKHLISARPGVASGFLQHHHAARRLQGGDVARQRRRAHYLRPFPAGVAQLGRCHDVALRQRVAATAASCLRSFRSTASRWRSRCRRAGRSGSRGRSASTHFTISLPAIATGAATAADRAAAAIMLSI